VKDLSRDFSLYIHIPFCVSKCAYCDFLSFADCAKMESYFTALEKEILRRGKKIDRTVDHIYIGGGTPSIAYPYFPRLKRALEEGFRINADAEISMECNPESVSERFVEAAQVLGVNRISVGVQTLSDRLLQRIGRAHNASQARKALSLLRSNFGNLNVDMMVGLPEQKEEDVRETTEELLSYAPEHLSCYSLIVEKGTPLYRDVKKGAFLPDEDLVVDCYDYVVERLGKAGLRRYEISNFCRGDAVCKYNASVWQYADYLGLGIGASSFMKGKGLSFPARRRKNTGNLDRYIREEGTHIGASEMIDEEEGKREFLMLGLRTECGVDTAFYRELFHRDLYVDFGERINKLQQFLEISKDCLIIKPEYFYISNSVIAELI